jgi:hypothetical protein
VAVAQIDGDIIFGVNAWAPGYWTADQREADAWRAKLIDGYPDVMKRRNIGRIPNDAIYHAEETLLIRAATGKADALAGRTIEVYLDRDVCAASCERVLPILGLELGNPAVTFVNVQNGRRWTMRDGRWLARGRR